MVNDFEKVAEAIDLYLCKQQDRMPTSVGELIGHEMEGPAYKELSKNKRLVALWYRVNGDIERAHTVNVYVKSAKKNANTRPILCVCVDNHATMTDFYANREIYFSRFLAAGEPLQDIKFLVAH